MRQQSIITVEQCGGVSYGERWALEVASMILWPLGGDQRITVLINLLASQLDNEEQVNAISDMLKLSLRDDANSQGMDRQDR
jgi:hypothetical protein